MTDPFADLERELLAAHVRDLRPRRHLRAAPRVLAISATAAAAVAAVVFLGARTDAERAAAPQPAPVLSDAECEASPWQPTRTSEPAPEPIASRLMVLREPPRPSAEADLRIFGAQATRVYGEPVRAGRRGDYAFAVVAADIVPRDQVTRQGRPCDPPPGATVPGACLHLGDPKGGLGACFTVEELEAGEAFIDADGGIYGLAPDGVKQAVAGGDRSSVDANLFALPGGPETKVELVR